MAGAKSMITTVALNPCIDETVTVERLIVESTNRVAQTRREPGGKGINVSIALRQLGYAVQCVGIDFSEGEGIITNHLERRGITCDFALQEGALRTNIKIFDSEKRTLTELNEVGAEVSAVVLREVAEKIKAASIRSDILVLSGSVPNGAPETFYGDIIKLVRRPSLKIIVDASNACLHNAICAETTLIKPNIAELEQTFGVQINTMDELAETARLALGMGAGYVCVSMGKHGAAMFNGREAWYAPAPPVDVRGIQGAGDAMVAGICAAFTDGAPVSEMLRYGVAASAGALMQDGTAMCMEDDFRKLLPDVVVMDYSEASTTTSCLRIQADEQI